MVKRRVFRRDWKTINKGAEVMCWGKLFQCFRKLNYFIISANQRTMTIEQTKQHFLDGNGMQMFDNERPIIIGEYH